MDADTELAAAGLKNGDTIRLMYRAVQQVTGGFMTAIDVPQTRLESRFFSEDELGPDLIEGTGSCEHELLEAYVAHRIKSVR